MECTNITTYAGYVLYRLSFQPRYLPFKTIEINFTDIEKDGRDFVLSLDGYEVGRFNAAEVPAKIYGKLARGIESGKWPRRMIK